MSFYSLCRSLWGERLFSALLKINKVKDCKYPRWCYRTARAHPKFDTSQSLALAIKIE